MFHCNLLKRLDSLKIYMVIVTHKKGRQETTKHIKNIYKRTHSRIIRHTYRHTGFLPRQALEQLLGEERHKRT